MENKIISTRDTHNHPSDAAELEAEKITTTIKRKVLESVLISTLYLNEVHQLASRADMREIAAKLPTFHSARSLLYGARRKRLPRMPQSRH